jgi:hypothetical protein
MKKRHLQSSYNYRFQEQSKRKRDYEKLKKMKEKAIKPEDATEELEYIKKLLGGEDVGDFGPEEPKVVETNEPLYWASGNPWLVTRSSVSKRPLSELLSGKLK